MATKRKISIRKVLQVFTTLVVTVSCVIAISSAAKIEGAKYLDRVEVHINSGKKYHFIEAEQILNETINNRNIDVMHIPVNKLDIQSMEQVLRADPWVADASLYVDAARVLHISVTQRIPVVRLFQQNGTSCYMDNTYSLMPIAPNSVFYTSVVTNVPVLSNDSLSKSMKQQIAMLAHAIQADTFWNAQVSQIIVDSDRTFELMPVLGQQRIIFGDTSRMKEKFSNLYSFYINVLNRVGWDKYETLDVRFKGQVVASPSLPYKGPVDKATASMNWVNSIVQTEARIDSLHTEKEVAKAVAKAEQAVVEKKEPKQEKKETKTEKKDARPAEKTGKQSGRKVAAEVKNARPQVKDKKDDKKKEDKKVIKKEDKKEPKTSPKKDDKKDKAKEKAPVKKEEKKGHDKEKSTGKKEEKKKDEKKPKYTLPEHKDH
jgi:cell division protein FtsQ